MKLRGCDGAGAEDVVVGVGIVVALDGVSLRDENSEAVTAAPVAAEAAAMIAKVVFDMLGT